jgi:Na+-translocating ferredoxin:NAD+ oxidoreductase RnfG subunit
MDKALFRAYVKELVKEQIEESVEKAVKKILPEVLGEAIAEIKSVQQPMKVNETATAKPKLSRGQLAAMMGLERHGDTITATSKNVGPVMQAPQGMTEDNPTLQAINRDYSALMKAMKLT